MISIDLCDNIQRNYSKKNYILNVVVACNDTKRFTHSSHMSVEDVMPAPLQSQASHANSLGL